MSSCINLFPSQFKPLSECPVKIQYKVIKALVMSLVIVGFLSVSDAQAQSQGQPYHPKLEQPEGAKISPDQAMAVAKEKGRVLSILPVQQKGQWLYRVKILNGHGQVSVLFVDATTGQLLQP